jgi:hypothetical protein
MQVLQWARETDKETALTAQVCTHFGFGLIHRSASRGSKSLDSTRLRNISSRSIVKSGTLLSDVMTQLHSGTVRGRSSQPLPNTAKRCHTHP